MPNKRPRGLEGVIALQSSICEVDGERGRLYYRGIELHELATQSTYEETAYLLWNGRLPDSIQLRAMEKEMFSYRDLPCQVPEMIRGYMTGWDSMEALRTCISALSGCDPSGLVHGHQQDMNRAALLTARAPVIVATYHRARKGLPPVEPRSDLRTAANFLYMLEGKDPSDRHARILDIVMVVHADHELNASTFAARVAASTLADIYAAVTSAIGTLDGPLHGGANEDVMQMLEEIGSPDRAEQYVKGLLARGRKVPGFGHRVYKTADPRATELRPYAEELARETGETRFLEISRKLEEIMMREKGLNANLDFISALVYHGLGIPTDLMTPLFACSRMAGWTAHILEQYSDNRLIRPRAEYVGPRRQHYVPMEKRQVEKAA